MEDGTGIVHIAPAFGEDDARVGRKYDAPFVQMVDEAGVMKPETPFAECVLSQLRKRWKQRYQL